MAGAGDAGLLVLIVRLDPLLHTSSILGNRSILCKCGISPWEWKKLFVFKISLKYPYILESKLQKNEQKMVGANVFFCHYQKTPFKLAYLI